MQKNARGLVVVKWTDLSPGEVRMLFRRRRDYIAPLLGEAAHGKPIAHGLTRPRTQAARQLGVLQQRRQALPEHGGVVRHITVHPIHHGRCGVGQRHCRHARGHGFQQRKVVAVLVGFARHVQHAAVTAQQLAIFMEGLRYGRARDIRIRPDHPVRQPLARGLLKRHVEHQVSWAHGIAHADDAPRLAGITVELFQVNARRNHVPRHPIAGLLALRDVDRCEGRGNQLQQLCVSLHRIAAVRGRRALHEVATIVEYDQLGRGGAVQVQRVHLVLRDDYVVMARFHPRPPVLLGHQPQVSGYGAIGRVPCAREVAGLVHTDVHRQARLRH